MPSMRGKRNSHYSSGKHAQDKHFARPLFKGITPPKFNWNLFQDQAHSTQQSLAGSWSYTVYILLPYLEYPCTRKGSPQYEHRIIADHRVNLVVCIFSSHIFQIILHTTFLSQCPFLCLFETAASHNPQPQMNQSLYACWEKKCFQLLGSRKFYPFTGVY